VNATATRCGCEAFAAVTEAAALASGRWLGRGDKNEKKIKEKGRAGE